MKKTVLVIGAGASVDYGYPLWNELKEQLCNLDLASYLKRIDGLGSVEISAHMDAFEEFQANIARFPDYTLDRIIYEMDKPKFKHANPTGHLVINIVGRLLAEREKPGLGEGWVRELQEYLIRYLARAAEGTDGQSKENLLKDLSIISLNYDRAFEHIITNKFFNRLLACDDYAPKDLSHSLQIANLTRLQMHRPHGYIALLKSANDKTRVGMRPDLELHASRTRGLRITPYSSRTIAYGDPSILERSTFLHMGQNMYVVNERGKQDYAAANRDLAKAENVFCLGLSAEGIVQSSLSFMPDQKVYLSNSQNEVREISKTIPGPDYRGLSSDGTRLNATQLPSIFNQMVLT